MYQDKTLLQYARGNLADFADFMFENDLAKECELPPTVGLYVIDARGKLWGKEGNTFYYKPYIDKCYSMPHGYRKYEAIISYELLMNAHLKK